MKREFLIERQGRTFCLYAGLLDLATTKGLKSIHTAIVQAPTDANNRVAIATAVVVLEKEGAERTFTGIGDAAPNNVTPAMQTCLLRMAETRAKARALRDATNIGIAAFEELPDEDHSEAPRPQPKQRPPVPQAAARPQQPPAQQPAQQPPAAQPSGAGAPKTEADRNGPPQPQQIPVINQMAERKGVGRVYTLADFATYQAAIVEYQRLKTLPLPAPPATAPKPVPKPAQATMEPAAAAG